MAFMTSQPPLLTFKYDAIYALVNNWTGVHLFDWFVQAKSADGQQQTTAASPSNAPSNSPGHAPSPANNEELLKLRSEVKRCVCKPAFNSNVKTANFPMVYVSNSSNLTRIH